MKAVAVAMAVLVGAIALMVSCAGPAATPMTTERSLGKRASCPAEASFGDTWLRPADGAVMVCVPAGEFPYGPGSMADPPKQSIYLDAFWIDKTEVTNKQYARCVASSACDEPLLSGPYQNQAWADHPVIWVNRREAEGYCRWAGARLPLEIEWEKAARGTDGRRYPWGDEFDASLVNYYWSKVREPRAVGSYLEGASPYGVLDMSGNVCEWVQELWQTTEDYIENPIIPPGSRPKGKHPVGHHYTLRGGSWASLEKQVTTYARSNDEPVWRSKSAGFRCACTPGIVGSGDDSHDR